MTQKTLPQEVLAHWNAADWNDEKMTASKYTYTSLDDATFGDPLELTDEESAMYSWGQCEDNITGGTQAGTLRASR